MTDTASKAVESIRRQCTFHYLDASHARIIHRVYTGMRGWVAVFGDGENGSYEYVIQPEIEFHGETPPPLRCSDAGYGSAAVALRDGLIAANL